MKRNAIILFILWALLCGCETPGIYDNYAPIRYTTVQLRQGIVLQDRNTDELSLLQVTAKNVAKRVLFTPQEGEYVDSFFSGHDGDSSGRLFVLTYVGDVRRSDVTPALHVIDVQTGNSATISLSSAFSKYRFSPDGQALILYHDDSENSSRSLSNPNEIAIVYLGSIEVQLTQGILKSTGTVLKTMSVDLKGSTIEGIHFLDSVVIGSNEKNLVAFATVGAIHLVDLYNADAPSVAVSLKNDTDSRRIVAQQFELIKGTMTHGPRIFVQADNASELYDIELNPRDNAAGFYATTSLLDGGTTPSDFAVLQDAGELFVVSASSQSSVLNIFEAATARITTVNLTSRVHTIESRTVNGRTELVMYGAGSNRIYFLNETDIGREMGDNLETLILQENIDGAQLLDNDRMLIYPGDDGLVLVDMSSRTVTHLAGRSSEDWMNNQLWNNTLFLTGYNRVDFLDVRQGTTGQVALDEAILQFHIFPAQRVGIAVHDTPTGRATMFPLASPNRANCRVFDGFLVSGILNRGEE
ncbi:MAG: hypothetical protein JXX14_26350 [Deltaproteobacteria bacterium]|nr:hypothetical protein [Deltaproteobacteria bacterium]